MEAAIRTVYNILEGKDLNSLEVTPVRGVENIKEASIEVAGKTINVAVVHGAAHMPEFFELLKSGKEYHFVEFMGCTGGCVNGGGQPVVDARVQDVVGVRAERAKALYNIDANAPLRQSHENPAVIKLYEEFLGKPNSHKAHELLHTHYSEKKVY
jgi:NADH-quinone oxidoreductase subunit G/NADP-reducing hydrogenase subunit HndD